MYHTHIIERKRSNMSLLEDSSAIPPKSLANRLGAFATTVSGLVEEKIKISTGLQGSDASAIILIFQKKSLRTDSLARQLRLAHSSIVRLVDRLVDKGYVRRKTGKDKRSILLSLTLDGDLAASQILSARGAVLDVLVQGENEQMQAFLMDFLDRTLEKLTINAATGEHICRQCDEQICNLETCPVETKYLKFSDALTGPQE